MRHWWRIQRDFRICCTKYIYTDVYIIKVVSRKSLESDVGIDFCSLFGHSSSSSSAGRCTKPGEFYWDFYESAITRIHWGNVFIHFFIGNFREILKIVCFKRQLKAKILHTRVWGLIQTTDIRSWAWSIGWKWLHHETRRPVWPFTGCKWGIHENSKRQISVHWQWRWNIDYEELPTVKKHVFSLFASVRIDSQVYISYTQ